MRGAKRGKFNHRFSIDATIKNTAVIGRNSKRGQGLGEPTFLFAPVTERIQSSMRYGVGGRTVGCRSEEMDQVSYACRLWFVVFRVWFKSFQERGIPVSEGGAMRGVKGGEFNTRFNMDAIVKKTATVGRNSKGGQGLGGQTFQFALTAGRIQSHIRYGVGGCIVGCRSEG
jgi:hypothetical protein